jgi:hypothetical protein
MNMICKMPYFASAFYFCYSILLIACFWGTEGIALESFPIMRESIKKISLHESFIPSSLVMKRASLPASKNGHSCHRGFSNKVASVNTFRIGLDNANSLIVWSPVDSSAWTNLLCGTIVPMDGNYTQFDETNVSTNFQAAVNCSEKIIATWISSINSTRILQPSFQDSESLSSIQSKKNEPAQKWLIAGAHKKRGLITEYLLKGDKNSIWVSKEDVLKLALAGLVDVEILD